MPTADVMEPLGYFRTDASREAERRRVLDRRAAAWLGVLRTHPRRYHPLIDPAPGACDVCDWIQRQLDRPS